MNDTIQRPIPHLGEADLVRHIDGEGDAEEREGWNAHVRACPRCAREADLLRDRSDAITRWLSRAAFENGGPRAESAAPGEGGARATRSIARPRATAATPWLRAAAIILLLAAPLAALPPVRAWVAERIGIAADDGDAADAAAGPEAGASSSEIIRFVPRPGPFAVELPTARAGGTLTLARADGPEAVLEATDAGPPGPVVSADRLRLEGDPSSTASYVLSLPAAVTDVVVRIGGREVRIGSEELEATRVVPLTAGRTR